MTAVKDNPYRTLGLFGNSTEKELQKQIAIIKRFAEVGKTKAFDYDLPFWGDVIRTPDKIQEAASKIEQAKNKVLYALFWFINHGHIDETALNHLKEGNVEKAIEIWQKTLKDETITIKNFSSASNLSTLQLGIVTNNGSFDPEKFISSMELKGKLFGSEAFESFISCVAGNGLAINHELILKAFADEVISLIKPYLLKPPEKTGFVGKIVENGIGLYRWENGDLYLGDWESGKRTGFGIALSASGYIYKGFFAAGKRQGEGIFIFADSSKKVGMWSEGVFQSNAVTDNILLENKIRDREKNLLKESGISINYISTVSFINSFRSFPTEIKQYISKKFTDTPINQIENQYDICKNRRDESPSEAAKFGEDLFSKTKFDLLFLKNVLGENNVQFQMIVNKVAQEILQCSIDYFNEHRDSESYDPGDRALKVLKLAKSLNPTGQVKSRVEENGDVIQEWVDDKPEREQSKKSGADIAFIVERLQRFQNLTASTSNAREFVNSCKPRLGNIKSIMGANNDLYLKISSGVVGNALGMLISVVNEAQEGLQYDYSKRTRLPSIISDALDVMNLMSGMDMSYELRNRFNTNKNTISNINSDLRRYTSQTSSSSSSQWCYVATMAYGSYDHPQVVELRKFRDNTLSNFRIGRSFIQVYYRYSPKLVKLLEDKPTINKCIRSILNLLIRCIK